MEFIIIILIAAGLGKGTQDYQDCKKDFTAPGCEWAKEWCEKGDENCRK